MCSAVAEMGDRLATTDMAEIKEGAAVPPPPPFGGGGAGSPSNTMSPGARPYLHIKWHLNPFSRLVTTHMGRELEAVPFCLGVPCNTMRPGPRPTVMPSFILIHIQPLGHNTPTSQTDRQTGQRDGTTVRAIAYRANRFTNGRPET